MSALLLLCWTVAAGLRINGTHSFPPGLYLAMHKQPVTGDLVIVNLPATPIFELAKAREYLNVAFSPVGRVMKRVAAVAGARVTISAEGVEVNGIRLHNSTPLPCDSAGRPLQFYALKDHVLGPSEVLLMSDY